MMEELSILLLLRRIQKLRRRQIWSNFSRTIQNPCLTITFCLFIPLLFGPFNRIYSHWKGPVPMNFSEFQHYLQINSKPIVFQTELTILWSQFWPKYIQLELNENIFDESPCGTFKKSEDNSFFGQTSYKYHTILDSYLLSRNTTLYMKYLADDQMQYERRYPFRFEYFHLDTFRCIVNQLDISLDSFNVWLEQSIHIEKIQKIYDDDPKRFNEKAIKKCSIILGYLYRHLNEYSNQTNRYDYSILDASPLYSPYWSYAVVAFSIVCIIASLIIIFRAVKSIREALPLLIQPSLKKQMDEMNIISLEQFDNLLMNSTYENNYQARLFIILNKYLIISKIDFDQTSETILQRFIYQSPVFCYSIDNIIRVLSDGISYKTTNVFEITQFPMNVKTINFNPAPWLHKRLIVLNDQYRNKYTGGGKESITAEQEQCQRMLQRIIQEETEYQQYHYRNRYGQYSYTTIPASPRFIAQFRLAGWKIVNGDLHGTKCVICLENLRLHQFYREWPCSAKHIFHYDCMLNSLRIGNKCPLCRHPVEATNVFNDTVLFQ